jgi:hypothetical protein
MKLNDIFFSYEAKASQTQEKKPSTDSRGSTQANNLTEDEEIDIGTTKSEITTTNSVSIQATSNSTTTTTTTTTAKGSDDTKARAKRLGLPLKTEESTHTKEETTSEPAIKKRKIDTDSNTSKSTVIKLTKEELSDEEKRQRRFEKFGLVPPTKSLV